MSGQVDSRLGPLMNRRLSLRIKQLLIVSRQTPCTSKIIREASSSTEFNGLQCRDNPIVGMRAAYELHPSWLLKFWGRRRVWRAASWSVPTQRQPRQRQGSRRYRTVKCDNHHNYVTNDGGEFNRHRPGRFQAPPKWPPRHDRSNSLQQLRRPLRIQLR